MPIFPPSMNSLTACFFSLIVPCSKKSSKCIFTLPLLDAKKKKKTYSKYQLTHKGKASLSLIETETYVSFVILHALAEVPFCNCKTKKITLSTISGALKRKNLRMAPLKQLRTTKMSSGLGTKMAASFG